MKKFKTGIMILMFCILCLWQTKIVQAAVSTGKCGNNVTYRYDNETRTLTLSGSGPTYNYSLDYEVYRSSSPVISYMAQNVIVEEGITSIGDYLFYKSGINKIKLPNSLTSIGKYAFGECESLTDAIIPASLTTIKEGAFYYAGIMNVTIPGKVAKIEDLAFSNCQNLKNVKISDGVTSIETGAFNWCSSLKSITIPNTVVRVKEEAFDGCESLESVKFSERMTKIEPYSFGGCAALKSIVIPNNIKMIEISAFNRCKSLESVIFGNGVTTIGTSAFNNCNKLTGITIPENVSNIGDKAFEDCNRLQKVIIQNKNVSIGKNCFSYYNNNYQASPVVVIYGYKDSTAQKYANKNKIGFQTIGQKQAAKSAISSLSSGKSGYQVQAKFKKVSKAYQYEIQINTKADKNGRFQFVRAFTKKNTYKLKKNKNLKKGKTYYVRVRAYVKKNGKQIISPWSKVKKLKMKK